MAKKKVAKKRASARKRACLFTMSPDVLARLKVFGGGNQYTVRLDSIEYKPENNEGRANPVVKPEKVERLREYLRTSDTPTLPALVVQRAVDDKGEEIPGRYVGVDGNARCPALLLWGGATTVEVFVLHKQLTPEAFNYLQACLNSLNGEAEATKHNISTAVKFLHTQKSRTAEFVAKIAKGIGITVTRLKAAVRAAKLRTTLSVVVKSAALASVTDDELLILKTVGKLRVLALLLTETHEAKMAPKDKVTVKNKAKKRGSDEARLKCIRDTVALWKSTNTFHDGKARDVRMAETMIQAAQRLANSLDKLGVRDVSALVIGDEEQERIKAVLHRLDLVVACWRAPQSGTGGTS